ncbi:40s ribosomal protein [Mycena rebaudengoi]|nr:40s ribosomal protein [Mycena rebaudengoi]
MSLVVPEAHQQFQHILRLLNTNVDGKRKIMYALTEIKGVGCRYSNLVCKKADVDLDKRCCMCRYTSLHALPVDAWCATTPRIGVQHAAYPVVQTTTSRRACETRCGLGSARDETERRKLTSENVRRETRGMRVRGQHTKTTGRCGKTVGVSKKRG